jgi:hypothetical protein
MQSWSAVYFTTLSLVQNCHQSLTVRYNIKSCGLLDSVESLHFIQNGEFFDQLSNFTFQPGFFASLFMIVSLLCISSILWNYSGEMEVERCVFLTRCEEQVSCCGYHYLC